MEGSNSAGKFPKEKGESTLDQAGISGMSELKHIKTNIISLYSLHFCQNFLWSKDTSLHPAPNAQHVKNLMVI